MTQFIFRNYICLKYKFETKRGIETEEYFFFDAPG